MGHADFSDHCLYRHARSGVHIGCLQCHVRWMDGRRQSVQRDGRGIVPGHRPAVGYAQRIHRQYTRSMVGRARRRGRVCGRTNPHRGRLKAFEALEVAPCPDRDETFPPSSGYVVSIGTFSYYLF